MKSSIYTSYKENIPVGVKISALMYAPNHILTAIVFPKAPCRIGIPHMTLAVKSKMHA